MYGITAQLSLYPLRQDNLSPSIDVVTKALARQEGSKKPSLKKRGYLTKSDQIFYSGPVMRPCEHCGYTRAYELFDGRFKCKSWGRHYTWSTAWASMRLAEAVGRVPWVVIALSAIPVR